MYVLIESFFEARSMTDCRVIIVESDGDLPFYDCVLAEINYRKQLVIEYTTQDYKTEAESKMLAIVDSEDTAKMAAHLNVPIEQLPQCIYDKCGDWRDTCTFSEVKGIFKDVLDFILDCGVKFVLKR